MIIVTGIGRCGTSIVTKWLKECGLNVGSDKWFKVYNAGLENKQTLDINARLFRHYVKKEDINLHHVRGDIEELHFDAVKDTRFLVHPALIREWASVRDDLKIVWMRRDPEKIVESVYRLPEWNTPVYRTRVDLIYQKEQEFEDELKSLGIEYGVFQFPQILKDPDPLLDFLWSEISIGEGALKVWFNLVDGKEH